MLYRFRDKARLVENRDFLYPLHLCRNIVIPFGTKKLVVWLPYGEKSLRICLAISTEYRRVTDRRTDRQTSRHSIVRAMHTRRAVKMVKQHAEMAGEISWDI